MDEAEVRHRDAAASPDLAMAAAGSAAPARLAVKDNITVSVRCPKSVVGAPLVPRAKKSAKARFLFTNGCESRAGTVARRQR